MSDFIAALGKNLDSNWEICKREKLWGTGGTGTNWRSNSLKVQAGDRIFIWKSQPNNGFIAQIEATGPAQFVSSGVSVPWPNPGWFGAIIPMRVVAELSKPESDTFPRSNGSNGLRFGFNNTALQHVFEAITPEIAERIASLFPPPALPSPAPVGVPYVTPSAPGPVAISQPFEIDPDLVDRALDAHHSTVEALAVWVRSRGLEPLLPIAEPWYDLAWFDGADLVVAEVKSLTLDNEEKQLRLGLGQVLRYRHQLTGRVGRVDAWLVGERAPTDTSWFLLGLDVGVRVTWPGNFGP